MLFYKWRRKNLITGEGKNGELFDVLITKKEEISEDTFKEFSDGGGEDVE